MRQRKKEEKSYVLRIISTRVSVMKSHKIHIATKAFDLYRIR